MIKIWLFMNHLCFENFGKADGFGIFVTLKKGGGEGMEGKIIGGILGILIQVKVISSQTWVSFCRSHCIKTEIIFYTK